MLFWGAKVEDDAVMFWVVARALLNGCKKVVEALLQVCGFLGVCGGC